MKMEAVLEKNISPSLAEEWTSFLTAEMLICGVLGKALYEYPDPAWLHSLAVEGVFSEMPLETTTPEVLQGFAVLQDWAAEVVQDTSGETYEALRDDYTRLFVGPGVLLAPPWGSVYFTRDRLIFQEQTLEVRNWYQRFGLAAEKLHQEPDDHIGLELIFLAHLAQLGLAALDAGDDAQFMRIMAAQWRFLQEQPLRWANQWCTDVIEFSRGKFYRGVALVLKGTLIDFRTMFEKHLGA